ncbi:MAG: glycosyltransferase family 9 protein, partial [Candidatus Omnitrophota bacterium]
MEDRPKSFLIINPFGIGDVLFSLPLISNLKKNFPSCKVFYLCNRRTQPLLENFFLINKTFVYERDEFEAVKKRSRFSWIRKIGSFISAIKKENIAIAIDLSLSSQFGFFAWAAGIKQRIGYDYKKRGRFLTKKISLKGYEAKHVIEYYRELLKLIGLKPEYQKTRLTLTATQKNNAANFLSQQGIGNDDLLITITPCGGASWGRDSYRKHWPGIKFAELADRLINQCEVRIILAGSSSERETIEAIEGLMQNKPVKAIDLPLLDFLALLQRSALLIANDGGPVHMGVFSGIKTVSIFGPVSEVVYGPYPEDSQKHGVIKKDLSCRPCYKKFRLPECLYQLKCLKSIT